MADNFNVEYENCPIVGAAIEYPAGFIHPFHSHDRAQLLFASSGIMVAEVPSTSYFIPPGRALWVPSGVPHKVACRSDISLRTLYITTDTIDIAAECRVLEVSDFLRALILEAVHFPAEEGAREREEQIVRLLAGEIAAAPRAPLQLKMPSDQRLLAICREIQDIPSNGRNLDEWATFAGMSKRSLTRLFRGQTGISLSAWRQQARLLEALSLLAAGQPVTEVAYAVGYESSSSFSAVFRQTFGTSPKRYRLT